MTKYLTVSIFYSVKNLVRFQIIGQYVGLDLFRSTGGVGHFDEMFLLFKQHLIPADGVYSEIDRLTSKNLLRLWTDFAKTGNPTPDPSDVQWDRCLFLHSVFMNKKITLQTLDLHTIWSFVFPRNFYIYFPQKIMLVKSWLQFPLAYLLTNLWLIIIISWYGLAHQKCPFKPF